MVRIVIAVIGVAFASAHRQRQNASASFLETIDRIEAEQTPLATDIPSIMGRFATMTKTLETLTAQITAVQTKVTTAETLAAGATQNLATSMNTLTAVDAAAKANALMVAKLSTDATTVGVKVDAAQKQMNSMQKTITALDGTAKMMGQGSVKLGAKLTTLEATMKETLPGVGTISKRIDTVTKVVTAYEAEVKKGIDKVVSKELRGMIDGVRTQVKGLTFEVANSNQGKSSTNTTKAAATTTTTTKAALLQEDSEDDSEDESASNQLYNVPLDSLLF